MSRKIVLILTLFFLNTAYGAEKTNLEGDFSDNSLTITYETDFLTDEEIAARLENTLEYNDFSETSLNTIAHEVDFLTEEELAKRLENCLSIEEELFPSYFQKNIDTRLYFLMSQDTYQEKMNSFASLNNHMNSLRNSNVHVLDPYIMAPGYKARDLLTIGQWLDMDNGALTLAEVGQEMAAFITNQNYLFEGFKSEEKEILPATFYSYLTQHFSKMDGEVAALCPESREIWSRAWSLSKSYYEQTNDFLFLKIVYDQVCENYLTGGGCIQGRITRGFIAYTTILRNILTVN